MARTDTWRNFDGLNIKWGQGYTDGRGGMYSSVGPRECYSIKIDLTDLTLTGETILSDLLIVPRNALIEKIEVVVLEASVGANANLDVGLVDLDGTSNANDDALLDAADAWHAAAVGTVTEYYVGTTEVGAQVGVMIPDNSSPRLITAGADTALFTDGVIELRVYYQMYPLVGVE